MMNSGPRRVKYRAVLNHTGDDDRVGHCQSQWHFACHRVLVFVVCQKKIVLTMTCLYRNKVSSSGAGVVIAQTTGLKTDSSSPQSEVDIYGGFFNQGCSMGGYAETAGQRATRLQCHLELRQLSQA